MPHTSDRKEAFLLFFVYLNILNVFRTELCIKNDNFTNKILRYEYG